MAEALQRTVNDALTKAKRNRAVNELFLTATITREEAGQFDDATGHSTFSTATISSSSTQVVQRTSQAQLNNEFPDFTYGPGSEVFALFNCPNIPQNGDVLTVGTEDFQIVSVKNPGRVDVIYQIACKKQ